MEKFCSFRRNLFHASLTAILGTLHAGMTTPEVTLCPDGHYRCVVYGLGPYIADYPEQVQLAGIILGYCPRYILSSPLHSHRSHIIFRCNAHCKDLDAEHAGPHSHEYTQQLIDTFDDEMLRKMYGVATRNLVR